MSAFTHFATNPRRLVAVGAGLSVLGLAIAGTAPIAGTSGSDRTAAMQTAGGILVMVGWILLAWGIHRLGRGDVGRSEGGKSEVAGGDVPVEHK
jgi:hypothetical protein